MQATGSMLLGLEAKLGVAGISCQHRPCSSWRNSAPMVPPAPCHVRRHSKRAKMAPQAGIKAIESFDATFELNEEQDAALRKLLATEPFCQQVVRETQQPEGTQLEFTGMLFQPVPWSVNTKRGCPPQYEQFLDSPSHVVINVPPNFMFQSKIFKPSRLCTIYKHVRVDT